MSGRAGLRRPNYTGNDPDMQAFERAVNDNLRYLQTLPFADGTPFFDVDFSSQALAGVNPYPLKHTMKRKARGILVISCKPKDPSTIAILVPCPAHFPKDDTEFIAYVALNQTMAEDFLWSFWVW